MTDEQHRILDFLAKYGISYQEYMMLKEQQIKDGAQDMDFVEYFIMKKML